MFDNINISIYIPALVHHSSDSEDSEDDMASPPDSRQSGVQRRDPLHSNGGRRPRLLRSSATEPSITTSTASRNALATPSTSRATDLLAQVAFSGSPPTLSSPLSQIPTLYESSDRIVQTHTDLAGFPHLANSDHYFSFPSFEAWHKDDPEEEREPEMQSL